MIISDIWIFAKKYVNTNPLVMIFAALTSSLAEVAGIAFIISLLTSMDFEQNNIVLSLYDQQTMTVTVSGLAFIILSVIVLKLVGSLGALIWIQKIKVKFLANIRLRFFALKFEANSALDTDTKSLNAVTEQAALAAGNIVNFFTIFVASIEAVVLIIFVLLASVEFAVLLVIFSFIGYFAFQLLNDALRTRSYEFSASTGELSEFFNFILTNADYISRARKASIFADPLANLIEVNGKKMFAVAVLKAWGKSLQEPCVILMVSVLSGISYSYLNLSLDAILASMILVYRAGNKIYSVNAAYQSLVAQSGSIQILEEAMNLSSFQEGEKTELDRSRHDVSGRIAALYGTSAIVLIVGKSGVGKSTVTDLVLDRLRESGGLRIGYVKSSGFLVSGSLSDNLFAPRSEVVSEAVKAILVKLDLDRLVPLLASDQNLLESNLSTGEIQRLSLARELICEPDVLVLDEPTSALDDKSEKKLLDLVVETKSSRKLTIAISHGTKAHEVADIVVRLSNKPYGYDWVES